LKFTVENFREDLGKTLGASLAHVVFKWGSLASMSSSGRGRGGVK